MSVLAGMDKASLGAGHASLPRLLVSCWSAQCWPLHGIPQVPMSKFEQEEYINDRYKAIEDRLKVGLGGRAHVHWRAAAPLLHTMQLLEMVTIFINCSYREHRWCASA